MTTAIVEREFSPVSSRWLAEIPTDWNVANLRHVCEITTGSGDTIDAEPDGDYPFIVRSDRPRRSMTYSFDTEAILTAGDGAVGEIFHHLHGKFHAHQRVYVLHNFRRVHPRFLYFYFGSLFRLMCNDGSARTTVDSVRRWMLTDMPVALPPLDEQRAIADYLDDATTRIDNLIAKQHEMVGLLEERRVAVVTAGIVGLHDKGTKTDSGVDWLPPTPARWPVVRAKIVTESVLAGEWGSDYDSGAEGVVVPVVRVADFDRATRTVSEAPTLRTVKASTVRDRGLAFGDLVLEKSGGTPAHPCGFIARFTGEFEAIQSNFMARVRLRVGQDPLFWLYAHAALYETGLTQRSVKQTTGIGNLDTTSYFDEKFAVPPLGEQIAIAARLAAETAKIDSLITKTREHIALAKERRSALITAAVTGQFDVRTATRKVT